VEDSGPDFWLAAGLSTQTPWLQIKMLQQECE